jgi:hypothetical protein
MGATPATLFHYCEFINVNLHPECNIKSPIFPSDQPKKSIDFIVALWVQVGITGFIKTNLYRFKVNLYR